LLTAINLSLVEKAVGCRRELCRNSDGAISGMKMVLDQAARSIVSFVADACVSVFQPSTLRMVI
jgi:N-acetylglucosamine-6-phosphate deacetylase